MKADITKSIPTVNSKSEAWIQWHKDLKSNFGKKTANSLWVKSWGVRGNPSANTSDLREYLEKQGIKIDKSAYDSLVDTGSGITDFFGDIFHFGKVGGMVLGGILIVGTGMVIYNLAKDPAKSIGTTLKYAK